MSSRSSSPPIRSRRPRSPCCRDSRVLAFSAAPSGGIVSNGNADEREEFDRVYDAAYDRLRRLASVIRRGAGATDLSATTLVNEAWIRLKESPYVARLSKVRFGQIAARAMRQVLVDSARRQLAQKRGGRDSPNVTLDEELTREFGQGPEQLLELDAALEKLMQLSERQAWGVIYRFFGGLTVTETADALGVSESVVHRDWRMAKAWLKQTLQPGK